MFKSTAKQAFKSAPTLARMYSDLPLSVKVTFPTGKSYDQPTGLFINNEFVLPKRKKTFEVISPSTEEEICHVYEAREEDIDAAVEAAEAAFNTEWSTGPPLERTKYMTRLADRIEGHADVLAGIDSCAHGN